MIAADPEHANAHNYLGDIIQQCAARLDQNKGDLGEVAALYEEAARLWGVSAGVEIDLSANARALAITTRARAGRICPRVKIDGGQTAKCIAFGYHSENGG